MFDEKPAHYIVQNAEKIEGFDKDDYGNTWYNVKFQDNAETFMWLAKNQPEEGKSYYGHFEKTKSGKKMRFKRDKEPDSEAPSKPSFKPKDEKQVTKNMCWKNLLQFFDVPTMNPGTKQWKEFWALVNAHTEMLLTGEQSGHTSSKVTETHEVPDPEFSDDPVFDPETGDRLL